MDIDKTIDSFSLKFVELANGCWKWTGAVKTNGQYGFFTVNGKLMSAHRAAYLLFKGPLLPRMEVAHNCHFGLCVNPDHLELKTHSENEFDKPLKTHCKRGHEFTSDNTQIFYDKRDGQSYRKCYQCAQAQWKARSQKHIILHLEEA